MNIETDKYNICKDCKFYRSRIDYKGGIYYGVCIIGFTLSKSWPYLIDQIDDPAITNIKCKYNLNCYYRLYKKER